jgi:hypothetical protein
MKLAATPISAEPEEDYTYSDNLVQESFQSLRVRSHMRRRRISKR